MLKLLLRKLVGIVGSLFCIGLTIQEGTCIYFTEAEMSLNVRLESLLRSTPNKTIRTVSAVLEHEESGTVNYAILSSAHKKLVGGKELSSGAGSSSGFGMDCPELDVESLRNGNGRVFVKQMIVETPGHNQNEFGEANDDSRYDCDYTVVADLLPEVNQKYRSKHRQQEHVQIKSARMILRITVVVVKDEQINNGSRSNSILPTGKISDSSLQNEELCFDGLNKLMLQIYENNQRFVLASFGFSDRIVNLYQADENKITYFIHGLNSKRKLLTVKESKDDNAGKFDLWVRPGLDRENLSNYSFKIACTVSTKDGNETFELPGALTVFDENDNGPIWSPDMHQAGNKNITNKIIYFAMDQNLPSLEGHRLQPDGGHIDFCFYDQDTSHVNNYQSYIMNDTKQLLDISVASDYDVTPENSSTPISMLVLKAVLKRSSVNVWDGNYCVFVVFNDQSTVRGNRAEISFTVCLYYKNRVAPQVQTLDRNNSTLTASKPTRPTVTEPTVKTKITTTRVSVSTASNGESLNLDVAPTSVWLDVDTCDSKCMNWIVGSTVAIIFVIITGLSLKVYLKYRNSCRSKADSCANDIESGGSPAVSVSQGQFVALQAWPIENGITFNISSDNGGSNNSLEKKKMQQADEDFGIDSDWIIPPSMITIKSVVGQGNFGQVCHAVYNNPVKSSSARVMNMNVAVKSFKESQMQSPMQSLLIEYETLKDLDHLHVVKLIGVVLRKPVSSFTQDLLVLEYAELKSLKFFLEKCRLLESNKSSPNRRITEIWSKKFGDSFPHSLEQLHLYSVTMDEIVDFGLQIADGMEYISRMRIVHRDLAARNVLLTSSKVCKITDFGLSRDVYLDDVYVKLSDETVPAKWLAPECFAVRTYTYSSDVWAFGIVLWELAAKGTNPYAQERVDPLYLYQYLFQGSRLSKPLECSDQFYDVMTKCWEFEAQQRPTFKELVEMLKVLTKGNVESTLSGDCGYYNMEPKCEVPVVEKMQSTNSNYEEPSNGLNTPCVWNVGYGYDLGGEKAVADATAIVAGLSCAELTSEEYVPSTTNSAPIMESKEVKISEDESENSQNVISKMNQHSDDYCTLRPVVENTYYNVGVEWQ